METNRRYPIRIVSKLTGLSADTLRAWERRYGVVEPERDDRGRLYSDADVERLNLLKEAVEVGHAISKLAQLSNEELKQVVSQIISSPSYTIKSSETTLDSPGLQQVIQALDNFDYAKVDRELTKLVVMLSPRDMVKEVVVPLMQKVGNGWAEGKISISQEHMISTIMRNVLGTMIRLYSRPQTGNKLLFATPSGEHHEFGILSAATLAASGGLGVVYLGVNLPASEIVGATSHLSISALVLGIVSTSGFKESYKCLEEISSKLPPTTELWVGGAKTEEMVREISKTRAMYMTDFTILEQHLMRLGANF